MTAPADPRRWLSGILTAVALPGVIVAAVLVGGALTSIDFASPAASAPLAAGPGVPPPAPFAAPPASLPAPAAVLPGERTLMPVAAPSPAASAPAAAASGNAGAAEPTVVAPPAARVVEPPPAAPAPPAAQTSATALVPTTGWISTTYGPGHAGIDIAAPSGAPVGATAAGVVRVVNDWQVSYGRHLIIDHGNGWESLYAHLLNVAVRPGQAVAAGQLLGWVGATGRATGPHLHFEIRYRGNGLDPLLYLPH